MIKLHRLGRNGMSNGYVYIDPMMVACIEEHYFKNGIVSMVYVSGTPGFYIIDEDPSRLSELVMKEKERRRGLNNQTAL